MGNYEMCIYDLSSALEINSRDPQVLYKQGLAYFAFGKYKKAISTMKTALRYKPLVTYEADIFYHLGLAYCRLEKFEKSIFPYTKCIEKVPSTSDVRYVHERAKAFQMIDEHERAVEDFNVVILKNPKNANAYFRRAFSLKSLKKYDRAIGDFEKAKQLDPTNESLMVNYKKLKGVSCIVLCEPGSETVFQ